MFVPGAGWLFTQQQLGDGVSIFGSRVYNYLCAISLEAEHKGGIV